jgi:hypothetical protein
VSINNKIGNKTKQDALSFLKSQKNLPVISLVSRSSSGIVVEVENDEADDLFDILDSKGFEYEEQEEEKPIKKAKNQKTVRRTATEVFSSPNTNLELGPWPY